MRENHVRFYDEDGMPIVTLCVDGDIDAALVQFVADTSYESDMGYLAVQLMAAFSRGHLLRPGIESNESVTDFVYSLSLVDGSAYVTKVDTSDSTPVYSGFLSHLTA